MFVNTQAMFLAINTCLFRIVVYYDTVTDLTVPVEDEHGWTPRLFSRADLESIISDMSTVTDEIKRLLVHAIMSKKRVILNFLLCQTSKSSASKTYIPATKTYYLLFLQTPVNPQGSFQARCVYCNPYEEIYFVKCCKIMEQYRNLVY